MESNLIEATTKQAEVMGELKDLVIKELLDAGMLKDLRPNGFKILQLSLELIDTTVEVNSEVCNLLSDIKNDTEKILAKIK